MGLFDDYCGEDKLDRLNSVEFEGNRFYLLPEYLEWYYQDISKPKKFTIKPKGTKTLDYDFGKSEFDQLLLCVTNRCNIVCDYCFRGYNFSKIKEINFEDFKRVADHFLERATYKPTIQFTGGEVFVKEGIENWFKYIHDRGFRIWMTTNGVHKKIHENDLVREVFQNNSKHHIRVSLDGSRADIHERYRQKGSFDKIVYNLKYLKSINASVSIKSVVTYENVEYLEEMLEMCYDLGLHGWNYNVIRYTGALSDNPPEDSTPKIDEKIPYFGYYELGVKLVEILERKPHLASLLSISRFGKILNTLYSEVPSSVPMSYYLLKFDGNVYYNDNLQYEEYSPGNIWKDGMDAFKGLKEFRKEKDYDLPACSSCAIHRFCFQKGDYGELYAKDPTLSSEFPNCDDIRKHYFHLMSLKERGLVITKNMFHGAT
jgi:radical SAM protein with 4Fe4S-binding SPASM domain